MMSVCNYCLLQGMKKMSRTVTTKESPDSHFPNGVDVYIDGVWAAWFAKLPTECHCYTEDT